VKLEYVTDSVSLSFVCITTHLHNFFRPDLTSVDIIKNPNCFYLSPSLLPEPLDLFLISIIKEAQKVRFRMPAHTSHSSVRLVPDVHITLPQSKHLINKPSLIVS
jgi:hypothetical protein